ncbi:MAG: hypothetical protein H7836_04755 [Magnetococcus sp. YQC-3]
MEEVTAEQVVTPDSFTLWNESAPFTDFIYPVKIEVNNNSEIKGFIFNTIVPTIKDHLGILKLVSSEKMKDNFDKFQKILSTSEELTLITKSIEIYSDTIDEKTGEVKETKEVVDGLFNVYQAINDFIPLNIVDEVAKEYDKKFKNYMPNFKKPITCGKCRSDFDWPVDIEFSLFRSFLKV